MNCKIDLITFDGKAGEFALYLVEAGPWPTEHLQTRVAALEARIRAGLEVVLLGLLAEKYPESLGKRVRLQIDLHDQAPDVVYELVNQLRDLIVNDQALQERIRTSWFAPAIRIVTREELGRT